MDELMKRYYTDTHQTYQAIMAEQQKENEHFKMLLEDGKISWQQYQIALVTIAADANAKIKNAQDKTNEAMKIGMHDLSSEFEKVFNAWQSGHRMTTRQILRDFIVMADQMILKMMVLQPLFGTGKAGNNEFGLVGNAISGVGSSLKSVFAGVFHDGGVVGAGGVSRAVSPGMFAGAVRYHEGGIAGLMPGEVPAILQAGETVLPKGTQPGGGHSFSFQIDARGSEIGVETKIAAALQQHAPIIVKQAVAAVEQTAKKRPGYLS
jgi:hypothetical protein